LSIEPRLFTFDLAVAGAPVTSRETVNFLYSG